MRAAVLYGIHDMRFEDRLEPILAPGQVIVRIGAVGICGSDVHYFAHGRNGPYEVNSPLVLGHECAGTVTEAGPSVTSVSVGDRVVVEPQRTCGLCSECTSGRYNLCRSVEFFATPPYDGALQEFMAVPERIVHRLPATMSMEQGALIEPLSVALAACDVIDVAPGDRVLVTGAGPIGVLVSRVALVASFFITTFAFGMIAPVLSATVALMEPLAFCAKAHVWNAMKALRNKTMANIVFQPGILYAVPTSDVEQIDTTVSTPKNLTYRT